MQHSKIKNKLSKESEQKSKKLLFPFILLGIGGDRCAADYHDVSHGFHQLMGHDNTFCGAQDLVQEGALGGANSPRMDLVLCKDKLFNIAEILSVVRKDLHVVCLRNGFHLKHVSHLWVVFEVPLLKPDGLSHYWKVFKLFV